MKRKRLRSAIGAAIVFLAIMTPPFFAQQRFLQNPKDEAALRSAIEKETVQGDLKGAIEQYKKLAQNNNKSLAARALVRLGQAYEKSGSTDARRAYEQVLSKFADQKEAADQARDRLSSLSVGSSAGLSTRKREDFDSLSISSDGRYIAYMDPESGDLGMRNTATVERRLLTRESRKMTNGYALGGAPFSPDGRQIAYLWDNSGNGSSCELRVTSTSGSGQPRTLLRCSQGTDIQWLEPSAWTPDGKSILAVLIAPRGGKLVTSVATFSVVDGKVNELKTFDGSWAIGHPTISPNGAYITYDRATRSDSPQRDIMILSTADLGESTLIAGSASDDSPVWSGDGKSILFRSDRRGVKDLMQQHVDQGRPLGSPELVKADIGNVTIIGLGTNGLLAFNQTTNLRRAYTAPFDPISGRASPPELLSERAMEGNVPHWSPDGKVLAMNFGNQIILRTRTGEERNFLAGFATRSIMDWFPDGSVLVVGANSEGKAVIVRYSFDPPRATPLPDTVGGTYRFQSISPDGKTAYRAQSATGTRILAVDLQSGSTRTVIDVPWIRSLALSPNGQQIAYVEGNTNDANKGPDTLYVINVGGGQPRKVTEFARPLAAIGGLQWAPDGRHLLIVVRGHGVDWVSVADGTIQPTGLTNVGGTNTGLAGVDGISISPDGRDLAFTIGGNKTETWILENFLSRAPSR